MSKDQIPQMQLVEEKGSVGELLSSLSEPEKDQMRDILTKMSRREEKESRQMIPEPSVALMLQKVIDGGITADNVSALEALVGLYDRMKAKNAEREFAAALTDLQGETSSVQATKAVDEKPDGTVRYRFAPYTEIMRTVKPMLSRYGFSVTFDTEHNGDRLTSICTLMHRSGHSRQNRFSVRYSGPPGTSPAQGDMSTKSYAKRGALCDCLNIVVEHDDDARMIGQPIGKALAEDLEVRVKAVGSDVETFLKYAGASKFEDISDEKWETLDSMLKRKEAARAAREKLSPEGEQWK